MEFNDCFDNKYQASSFLYLIRCCPNLEELSITVTDSQSSDIDAVVHLFEAQDLSDFSLGKLSVVYLHFSNGTKEILKIVQFLLAKSPTLEQMVIQAGKSSASQEGVKICKEITLYPRASPEAEITFENPPDNDQNCCPDSDATL
ncbi:hypothetical protein Tsubulata_045156 [Turnera subulata]|uniref:FBD domain-containing protein n=1 Tax=Turnera subulata TaxID=218843 RepID=A0A9Q0FKS2_9ROSI|nr:hypothetical protein Tsubulata_050670 [Turnera subulata]KAJ4839652.1 hypothetical protein Tsubulata_045156 [Turnera subulata]